MVIKNYCRPGRVVMLFGPERRLRKPRLSSPRFKMHEVCAQPFRAFKEWLHGTYWLSTEG